MSLAKSEKQKHAVGQVKALGSIDHFRAVFEEKQASVDKGLRIKREPADIYKLQGQSQLLAEILEMLE